MRSKQLASEWKKLIVGQDHVIEKIVPYVIRYQAGLSVPNHPIGNFFLLGSSGSGKTRTAETLAEILHNDEKKILKIDCAEYNHEHETAKLVGCFTADTKVLMSDGSRKSIVDVAIGDSVVSKNGEINPVIDKYEYGYCGNLLELCVAGSSEKIRVTPNHMIWAKKGWGTKRPTKAQRDWSKLYTPEGFDYIPAGELSPGDLVVYPRFKVHPKKQVEQIDLADYCKGTKFGKGNVFEISEEHIKISNHRSTPIKRFVSIEKLARLIGYYVSEGGVAKTKNTINFTFSLKERYLVEDVINLIQELFGPHVNHRLEIRKSSFRLFVSSKIIGISLSAMCGDRVDRKRIPEFILHAKEDTAWEFLDSAFMGDGGKTMRRRIDYSTVSLTLASQMELLIRRLGFCNQMQSNIPKNPKWKVRYRLYVSGAQIKNFVSHLRYVQEIVTTDFAGYRTCAIQRMQYVDDEYVYSKIRSIRIVPYSGKVYDFSVQSQHSYLVNCCSVSNSPPGYLGFKDSNPLLSQARINAVASDKSEISIILFDEIEKAHSAFWRLILGVLDKANLRLGDNQSVSFEKSIIFMSSNVGAAEMAASMGPQMGFQIQRTGKRSFESIGLRELGKKFPPEFANRIDETISYHILNHASLLAITKIEIEKVKKQILDKLGVRTFYLEYGKDVLEFLTEHGTSEQFGAREIKRTITRFLLNPLSDDFLSEVIKPGCSVHCHVDTDKIIWEITEPQFVLNPTKGT